MERAPASPSGPPTWAVTLLTWLVPGAGHLLLGATRVAVLGFVAVEGLYLLGFLLSGGLAFEFLDVDLRGRFALVLTPEIGNAGALVLHQMLHPLVAAQGYAPPPPPSTVHLGAALTAVSGVLNFALMAHVHLASRVGAAGSEPRRRADRTGVQVAAGWAVPGLGHWLQGRRRRAAIVAGLGAVTFAIGCVLADGTNLSREHHFYYWSGQFLFGLPAIVVEFLRGHPPLTSVPPMLDAGLFFGSLAGLLNGLVLIDVFAWGESRAMGVDPVEDRRSMAQFRRASKKRGAAKRSGDGAGGDGASSSAAAKHLVGVAPPTSERKESS